MARRTSSTVADELANAAARGDLQRLKELLDGAADPNGVNSYGRTPIQVGRPGEGAEGEGDGGDAGGGGAGGGAGAAVPPWPRSGSGGGIPRASSGRRPPPDGRSRLPRKRQSLSPFWKGESL